MSVYVGIDVHRKRSQVTVIDASGKALTNRNLSNGAEPILKVIGSLPPGRWPPPLCSCCCPEPAFDAGSEPATP
jgi:hypothetical protein